MSSSTSTSVTPREIAKAFVFMCIAGWAIIAFVAAVSPSREELEAREAQAAVDSMIANCVAHEGPWRCFVKLEDLDHTSPISGRTRLQRMARMVPAWEVLAFCTEPRKVDCADRMIGVAYSRESILAGMGE